MHLGKGCKGTSGNIREPYPPLSTPRLRLATETGSGGPASEQHYALARQRGNSVEVWVRGHESKLTEQVVTELRDELERVGVR